jgi:hypothetical protein
VLSIGHTNPYFQVAALKNKQKVDKKPQSQGAPKVSIPSKSSASNSAKSVSALDALAFSNLMHNSSLSPQLKEPALNSMSDKIAGSLNKETSKMASAAANLSSSKAKLSEVKSILSNDTSLSDDEKEIYQLISQALQSEVSAFEELLNKSKNAVSDLSYLAGFGVNKVVGESENNSSLLGMLSQSNSEYSAEATSKLLQMSAESPDASKKLAGLIQTNKVSLKKTAQKSKQEDPEKTATGLDNLYRTTNLSKEDRLTVTQVLTSIAVENPVNGAGKAAAMGLENIFKKDSGSVAKNAAVGLRFAAIAGNDYATEGLINVATSKSAGKGKNMEAITQLTKVAKTGGNQSQRATDALTKMAGSKNSGGDVKEHLLDSLQEIAAVGGNNGNKALDTLGMIAADDRSPHQKQAFSNILKLNNHKVMGNSKVVKAFSAIAESKRTDSKLKNQATTKLGEAMTFGTQETSGKAENTLVNIFKNPMNKARGTAQNILEKQGFDKLTMSNQNKIQQDQKPRADQKNKNGQFSRQDNNFNPFHSTLPFKYDGMKVAM